MKISYYNGEFLEDDQVAVDYNDRAVYFGDGVYEVVRIYDNEIFTFEEHLERLVNSAKEIRIKIDKDEIRHIMIQMKEKNKLPNAALYIQVSRGIEGRTHLFPKEGVKPVVLSFINKIERPVDAMREGVKVVTRDDYRWLKCHIKSLNLLSNTLLKQEAKDSGATEAILHRDGRVTEGTSTNVFAIKDGVLHTHEANNLILNGITRQYVIKLAQALDIPVKEEAFTVDFLKEADEVFITSTTQEITPVISVDEVNIGDGIAGEVTKKLQDAFEKGI
ncbi:D-amino-acid transaminase [Phocicoccus pinnipedialis]|uniref:D-alanine aminotransferase n=1 Tax=Phocicoccus pinnipedialis TaxID=110845 RepID=A0A6V7RBE8_9BACL|nr:D-amino-acid transaminase [Jeotgalicoccus pinnipedialis]MBP1939554.1 D-alanine transaminase [Jeotgalicoccus pinnipedialis]CAD2074963.1 putative branched-chain-amino-acid aminotransferase [Jeotgalicoccus pinnipedialis]